MAEREQRRGVRIFVSHSHKDDAFGQRLVGDLRAALGDDSAVWYDASGGLRGGDAWWRMIVHELSSRPVFIVVLSPEALASPWVNDEIDLAWKQKNSPAGKMILPVICRPCTMREDLTLLQHVSFVPPLRYEDGLAKVLAALGLLSSPSLSAPASLPLDAALASAQAPEDGAPTHDEPPADQHDASMPTAADLKATAAGATAERSASVPAPAPAPIRASSLPRRRRPSHARWRPSARVLGVLLTAVVLLVAGTAGLANATGALRLFASRPTTHATHGPSPTATATATRGPTPTPTLVLPAGFTPFDSAFVFQITHGTYQMGYPNDWHFYLSPNGTSESPIYEVNFTSPGYGSGTGTYLPYFAISQSAGWYAESDQELFTQYEIVTENHGTFDSQKLAGLTCARGTAVLTPPGATVDFRVVICRRNEIVYLFYMNCNAQTFAANDARYFEPMLNSFRFTSS